MQDDLAAFECRLSKVRERIREIHIELEKLDGELAELPDRDNGKRGEGNKTSHHTKKELLTRRAELSAELESLPGMAAALKFRAVHAELLLLRTQREFHRAEAHELGQKFTALDNQRSKTHLDRQHIIVQARHGHIRRDEAAVQTEPLTTELRDLEPHVKAARAELTRAQGRAAQQADVAKMRYHISLDASPEKWDEAAARLASEEREQVFRLCYPLLPWPKPIQPRPKIFTG